MKEKLIRKGYHLMGMLDGIALVLVIGLLARDVEERKTKKNKPLSEQVE